MPRLETMTSSTNRYLRTIREWLPSNHPLAVALRLTAAALDEAFQTSTMSTYTKQIEQIEKLRPAAGQPALPGISGRDLSLIGPRKAA